MKASEIRDPKKAKEQVLHVLRRQWTLYPDHPEMNLDQIAKASGVPRTRGCLTVGAVCENLKMAGKIRQVKPRSKGPGNAVALYRYVQN